jgi:Asp/Glu/hydantoin racemase
MDRFPSFLETGAQFEPGLSAQSSRNIHLYANDFSPNPLLLGILAGLLDCGRRCAIVRAMRIALIHALKHSLVPIEDAFAELWPEATRMNLLDDSLSADLARDERLTSAMTDRFLLLGRYAAATGADAILFTCSAFGPCIEAVARAHAPMPVLKPNEAMIEQAVARGHRIGLLSTFAPTLASMPAEFPSSIDLVPKLVDGALTALDRGDRAEHDRLVVKASRDLRDCDLIALAQYSMAPTASQVADATGLPVLTTPDSAVMKLKHALS